MNKKELNDQLNDLKREYKELNDHQKLNEELCEKQEKQLKSYVTMSGLNKAFIPFDVVTFCLGISDIALGQPVLGSVFAGIGAAGFILKLFSLKNYKKKISETKAGIAIGKFAQGVNEMTKKEIEQEIDWLTDKIYENPEYER